MSDPSELVLSASSLKTWLSCGRKYFYEQVLRMPGAPNMAMSIGVAVHAGVEAMHKGLDAEEAYGAALAGQLASMPGVIPAEAAGAVTDGLAMLGLYRSKVAPTFRPTMIEKAFVIRVNGTLVSGQIDGADNDVRDTKTTATLSKFRPERHRLQMTIYKHGYRALTGRWPGRLLLDVIARNGRWKTVEVESDDGEMVDVIALASRSIMSGEYEPTGALNGSCNRCSFASICEFAVLED